MERFKNLEQWRIARLIAYVSAQPYFKDSDRNKTIFEYYPLPDDPTPEEIQEAEKRQFNRDMDHARQVQSEYRKMKLTK